MYLDDDYRLLFYIGHRPLRSNSNDMQKLFVPQTHNKLGDRSFSATAHRLWNNLPLDFGGQECFLTPLDNIKNLIYLTTKALSDLQINWSICLLHVTYLKWHTVGGDGLLVIVSADIVLWTLQFVCLANSSVVFCQGCLNSWDHVFSCLCYQRLLVDNMLVISLITLLVYCDSVRLQSRVLHSTNSERRQYWLVDMMWRNFCCCSFASAQLKPNYAKNFCHHWIGTDISPFFSFCVKLLCLFVLFRGRISNLRTKFFLTGLSAWNSLPHYVQEIKLFCFKEHTLNRRRYTKTY